MNSGRLQPLSKAGFLLSFNKSDQTIWQEGRILWRLWVRMSFFCLSKPLPRLGFWYWSLQLEMFSYYSLMVKIRCPWLLLKRLSVKKFHPAVPASLFGENMSFPILLLPVFVFRACAAIHVVFSSFNCAHLSRLYRLFWKGHIARGICTLRPTIVFGSPRSLYIQENVFGMAWDRKFVLITWIGRDFWPFRPKILLQFGIPFTRFTTFYPVEYAAATSSTLSLFTTTGLSWSVRLLRFIYALFLCRLL